MRAQQAEAMEFANSPRGHYIVSQALTVAIEALEKVEPPQHREISNIMDMRFLRDNLFPTYSDIRAAVKQARGEKS
jgi:hypothetical protein